MPTRGTAVGILEPTGQNVFIAEIVPVLEVVQRNHQACADGRTTLIRTVGRAEQVVESIPVNRFGQSDQGMAQINDLVKLGTE